MTEGKRETNNRRVPDEERRHRNIYHPDSTTPVGHLDTTIDRSSKVNLFAAAVVVFTAVTSVGAGVWTLRGFVNSIEENTASTDELSAKMERALNRIEENAQSSAENRGRIEGLESEFERMNERIFKGSDNE